MHVEGRKTYPTLAYPLITLTTSSAASSETRAITCLSSCCSIALPGRIPILPYLKEQKIQRGVSCSSVAWQGSGGRWEGAGEKGRAGWEKILQAKGFRQVTSMESDDARHSCMLDLGEALDFPNPAVAPLLSEHGYQIIWNVGAELHSMVKCTSGRLAHAGTPAICSAKHMADESRESHYCRKGRISEGASQVAHLSDA